MDQAGRTARRRLSVMTIDQAIAGGSNVLAAVLAARLLGVDSFARFEIIFIVYVLLQGVGRALCCDPLLVHPEQVDARPGDTVGTAFLLGLIFAGVLLLGAAGTLWWDESTAIGLAVLAAALPLLFLQDVGRYLGFATQRPLQALILDTMWLVLMVGIAGLMDVRGATTLTSVVAGWAGAGALSGCWVVWRYRQYAPRPNLSWLRETWGFSWRYVLSFAVGQVTALGASLALAGIVGTRALGAARGASLLLRPSQTVQAASAAASTADIARTSKAGGAVRATVAKVTALTAAVGALNLIVLLALPDRVGVQLLGDTWSSAKPYFLPAGLQVIMLGMVVGMRSGMLGIREIRAVVKLDLWANSITFFLVVGGTVLDGLRGFYWGCVVSAAVMATIWLFTFLRTTRRLDPVRDGTLIVTP